MDLAAFRDLPDEAQLWIFGFKSPLESQEKERVEQQLGGFIPNWVSHQVPVRGAFEIVEDRFVLISGHCEGGLSGCSKDSCMSNFKTLKSLHGLDGLDRSQVFYRDASGGIRNADRATYQKLLDSRQASAQGNVFDTTLQSLGQLRSGAFETSFEKAWHARAFRVPAHS